VNAFQTALSRESVRGRVPALVLYKRQPRHFAVESGFLRSGPQLHVHVGRRFVVVAETIGRDSGVPL
jgi:hypothetical protein